MIECAAAVPLGSNVCVCVSCAEGAEAEAEVRAHEEAAVLHRQGRPGAARLPAGQPQLDGSLLVQVRLQPVAPLQLTGPVL